MALLQSRRGAAVILTQVSGDDKVDVLALNGREMRLVQCKHSVSRLPVDSDAITEILSAVDIYRHRYLRPLEGRCSLRLLVASNGSFTRAAVRLARENGVELLAGADIEGMLQETPCTKAEVAAMESSRLASMARLSEKIQALAARL